MKYIKTTLAACLSALLLPSCSSDDLKVAEEQDGNFTARITMTASREAFGDSRASFEDNHDGKLTFSWELGDAVYLTDEDGAYKGILNVVSVEDEGLRAVFEGSITPDVYNGSKEYVFYFFGNETEVKGALNEKNYDFTSQNGLLSGLAANDLLIGKSEVQFVDGQGSVDVNFKRQLAYSHYKLVYDGQTIDTKGVPVEISASNLASSVSVDFANGTSVPGDVSSFTVTPSADTAADEEGGFYVALVPNDSETTLTFTCTSKDGTQFIGTRKLSKLEKNDFYRLSATKGAIPIEMEPAKQYRVFYHVNIDIDNNDIKECTSIPYVVSGSEAAAYTVMSYAAVTRDDSKTVRGGADFSGGYFYDFLGWGTTKNMGNGSWKEENYGAMYKAKQDDADSQEQNEVIDLTRLATTEKDGYYEFHLYAKGTVLQYKYICVDDNGNNIQASSAMYRPTGSVDTVIGDAVPSKDGAEFLGWSRKTADGALVDADKPIKSGDIITIRYNEPYGDWNPDFSDAFFNKPIKGSQTLTLYPVWKTVENEPVVLPGYGSGTIN